VHRINRDQLTYQFAPNLEPVIRIKAGDRVVAETYDASTGRIRTPEDLAAYIALRDPKKVNPAAGPIWVEGARTGDELIVTIERITLTDQGYVRSAPGSWLLPDVELATTIVKVDGDQLVYPGGVRLPARPMVGVIGTAPPSGVVYTAEPGPQGSNLDCNAIRVGSRVHLPVHVEGALLAIGDVHASMGDGEVSGTGVEINAEIEFTVENVFCGSHGRAWIETADEIVATGSAPGVDQAIKIAVEQLAGLIRERHNVSKTEAFMLISARGDVKVGQCCGGLDATAYAAFPRF